MEISFSSVGRAVVFDAENTNLPQDVAMVQKVWVSIHKGLNPDNLSCVRDVGNFISPGLSKTFEYDVVPLVQKCSIKTKYFRMPVQTGASMCYNLLRLWTKLEWMCS